MGEKRFFLAKPAARATGRPESPARGRRLSARPGRSGQAAGEDRRPTILAQVRDLVARSVQGLDPNGPDAPCLIFTGARDADGYGVVRYEGRVRRVHKVAFFLATGTWPALGLRRDGGLAPDRGGGGRHPPGAGRGREPPRHRPRVRQGQGDHRRHRAPPHLDRRAGGAGG